MDCQLSPFIFTKIKMMKRGAWASLTAITSSFACWPCTMTVSRHSCEDPNNDGAIFTYRIINSKKEEGHYYDFNFLDVESYSNTHEFIIPDDTHARYVHQSGLFTLFKDPWEALELAPSFIVPNCEKTKILKDLALIGITDSYVLPNLDNLCKEIGNKYQNK